MDQLNSGIAVHSTDKHQQASSLTAQQGGEWGLRNRRVGGWGNKQWGKHSIRPAIVVFLQRGAGAKKNLRFFFAEPIFAKGTKPQINILLLFFGAKQHLGPGINRPENFEFPTAGSTFLGLGKSNFVLSTIRMAVVLPGPGLGARPSGPSPISQPASRPAFAVSSASTAPLHWAAPDGPQATSM